MGCLPFRSAAAGTIAAFLFVVIPVGIGLAQAPERTGAKSPGTAETPKTGAKPAGTASGGRPTIVVVDAVTRAELTETVPVYGRVIARQAGVVAARVRGAIAEIRADVGTRVKRGDILTVLESDMLTSERDLKTAELAEFRAKTGTAQAQLRLAEQELQRIERLRKSSAFSPARYDDKRRDVERYRSAMAETAARVKQAVASLNITEINLANANIRAPYNGVITQRHTEAGAYLNIGEKVVTMTNDEALEIEADVPARRLSALTPGLKISVDPETAPRFDVVVRAIVPEENQLTRTRTIRFVPTAGATPALLAANQSVIVHIPSGPPRTVTTAHKDALLHRRGSPVMFVFAGGKVTPRSVVLGEAFGSRFEIVSGLGPGDMVVTRGNERLRPGQEVQVREPGSRAGRPSGGTDGRRGAGRPEGRPGGAPDATPHAPRAAE